MKHDKIGGREIQVNKGREAGAPWGCMGLLSSFAHPRCCCVIWLFIWILCYNTLAGKPVPNYFLGSV